MIRKIILLVSVLVVGVLLFYGYGKMQSAQQPKVDIYSQVPIGSFVIIDIDHPFKQWDKIKANNIIWEELQIFENIVHFESVVANLDSSIKNQTIPVKFHPKKLIISVTKGASAGFSTLYQVEVSKSISKESILNFVSTTFNGKLIATKNSPQFEIESNNPTIYGSFISGILSLSVDTKIISDIQSHDGEKFIISDTQFTTVRETSSKNASIRFFIEPNLFLKATESITNKKTQFEISILPNLSSWTELDVDIKPDEISFSGFTQAVDSLNQWVSLFKNQEPVKPAMINFLPNRTAFMMHLGFSDFIKLRKNYTERKSASMGIDYSHYITEWDTAFDVSIEKDFISWIDNEIALIVTEPDRADFNTDIMVWIGSSDAKTLNNSLTEIALKVANKQMNDFNFITYKEHQIHQLLITDFLEFTLGEGFKWVTQNYFTQIEDYIVFANSPATLQWTIDRIAQEKTLANDEYFQSYANRISEESNIYFYSNIAASSLIYQSISNQELGTQINQYRQWLQKFQVASIQISYETEDLYYVNNYLKYNPVYKKESNSLWELPLLEASSFKPVFVKNHYTQATEIFTQDSANSIYLIDNKGNILWNRKVDGEIISTVSQIDALKNNKLQLIFNTQNSIYIIDRNGNDLTHFPIRLSAKATAPIQILDYEKTKDYRIIVPTESGNLHNFNVKGTEVKGWSYGKNNKIINQQILYTQIKGKDYLVVMFETGEIKVLDRRGNTRLNLKSKFNFAPIGSVVLQKGSKLENTFVLLVTNKKEVARINFLDHKERLFSINMDTINTIQFIDLDKNGSYEIIANSDSLVTAYKTDGSITSSFKTPTRMAKSVQFYQFSNRIYAGYNSKTNNKIYLVNSSSETIFPFPLKGNSPFSIADINNDGRFNLITVDEARTMINYTLDF